MNKWLKAASVGALAAGVCLSAHAGTFRNIDCNPDMYNLTGQTAHDFDILLGNFIFSNVLGVYTDPTLSRNPFPSHSVTDLGGGDVLVRYFGATVADGQAVHVGISVPGGLGTGIVKDQYWSDSQGNPIGHPAFRCNLLATDARDGDITNASSDGYWVQRRVLFQDQGLGTVLDDLLPDEALWNAASVIDANPVFVAGGQTLDYTFASAGHGAYIMAYTVWTDNAGQPGELSQRVMQANHFVPEPATLLLVGSGLVALWRRRTGPARPAAGSPMRMYG